MNKPPRLPLFIIIGSLIACPIGFPRPAGAAENDTAALADSFSRQKDALINLWRSADRAFTAALSVYGASKDQLKRYIAERKSLSDQARAWNNKVSRAGLLLPRLIFDVSDDKRKVKTYSEFSVKVEDMELAAERPMDVEKADTSLARLRAWAESGKISTAYFAEQAAKVDSRGRESVDLTCRLVLETVLADKQAKAQKIFDKNAVALEKHLTPQQYSAVRGAALGYSSPTQATTLLDAGLNSFMGNINLADIRRDSAASAEAWAKQDSLRALAAEKQSDSIENVRIGFLRHVCATFDTLKDPATLTNAAERAFGQLEKYNADPDDRRFLEERRDRRIKEVAEQAKAAQKAEAAAKAEAARQAKAAAEAEAARQKAEEQRRRLLADADAAIAAKRYEQAAALLGNYRAAGGDAKIADQMTSRIAGQRNADIEKATGLLIVDLEDAVRRALRAANTSDIQAEMARIKAVPKRIKQLGADSLKVSSAAAGALNRVGPLVVLAGQGDSLKAAWEQAGGLLARALSASGASKEELRKIAADRNRLSRGADAWNRKAAQEGILLPKLSFDASSDEQDVKDYLDFNSKAAALKKESAQPMSFGKADTLLARVQALAKNERIKLNCSDTIVANIKTQAGITAVKTDDLITRVLAEDPLKAQELLNRNSSYLIKYGSEKAYHALRDRVRVQIQAVDTRLFISNRMSDFRYLLAEADFPRARGVLAIIDSSVNVLRALSAAQAKPYSDTLKAFQSALNAKISEQAARAQRAKDSLLVLQKQRDSLRVADSLGAVARAEALRAAARADSLRAIARADSIRQAQAAAKARADSLRHEQAIAKAREDSLRQARAMARADSIRQVQAAAKARADSLRQAQAIAKAREDSLRQAQAMARADSIRQVQAAAKARADSLRQAQAIAKARADSLRQAQAVARADSIRQAQAAEQARADSLRHEQAIVKAWADSVRQAQAVARADSIRQAQAAEKAAAKSRADSLRHEQAMAKAREDSLRQARAVARADSIRQAQANAQAATQAAEKARADSLAYARTDSIRLARAESVMANAYSALYAVQDTAELRRVMPPYLDSMKMFRVDFKDVQYFAVEMKAKKRELDSLARMNQP